MTSGKIISMIAAGVAVGAGISILCTTGKGKSTVKKVTEGTNEYADKFKESIVNFLFILIDKLTNAKNESNGSEISNNKPVADAA